MDFNHHLVLKRIGKLIILSTPTGLKFISVTPSLSKIHLLIHRYDSVGTSSPDVSLLRKLLKSPLDVLRLPGPRKVNLVILLAFREYSKMPQLFSSIFSVIINDTSIAVRLRRFQRWIIELLMRDRECLKRLLLRSPHDFFDFITAFNMPTLSGDGPGIRSAAGTSSSSSTSTSSSTDTSNSSSSDTLTDTLGDNKSQYWLFSKELDVLHDCKNAELGHLAFKTIEMKIHCDFCQENTTCPVIFADDYKGMTEHIKRNRIFKTAVKGTCFYPEVALYNNFLFSSVGISCFDQSLFDREFVTKNEMLVKSYVKRRMKKQKGRNLKMNPEVG